MSPADFPFPELTLDFQNDRRPQKRKGKKREKKRNRRRGENGGNSKETNSGNAATTSIALENAERWRATFERGGRAERRIFKISTSEGRENKEEKSENPGIRECGIRENARK